MDMKRKYTISLIIVFIIFLACLFVFFEYRNYKSNKSYNEALTLVTEELSINYIDGNKIKLNEESKKIEFSITNHSNDTKYYFVKLKDIVNADNASYTLNANNQAFESYTSSFSKTLLASRIEIKPQETHRYTMTVENKDKDGLIRKAEQDGDVYYFRGNVLNNYVTFAGQLWRIVKINENKTVKLVLNNVTEAMIPFNTSDSLGNTSFLTSNLNVQLETFYNAILLDQDNLISSTRYCFDDSVSLDENNHIEFLASQRIFQEQNPTNACNGTSLSKKIATLTADEVLFAGGSLNENKDYYLYIPNLQSSWWTMTPNKREDGKTNYIAVMSNGSLVKDIQEDANLFLRPVITLIKKVNVVGDGTKENPYVIVSGS